MRTIDRLITRELLAPWLFGVGLFTALLMAATYLGRLAGFIVDGAAPTLIVQLVGLLFPAILVKTFTMAVLLAALLGFGRLSSESEIVALRAAGASIYRIVRPVVAFSVVVALATLFFNEAVVPAATFRAKQLGEEIVRTAKMKSATPLSRTVVENGKLRIGVVAKNVNPASLALEGVTAVFYDENGNEAALMFAKQFQYTSESKWRISGARIVSADLRTDTRVPGEVWPEGLPRLGQTFTELTAERDDDFDAQSMGQLRASIERHRAKRDRTVSQLANYEYGYWNKIAVPMAAIVFGTLGAVLGVRNHRTGTAAGFALAVAIIFGYSTLASFMNVFAQGGVFPAWMASFTPLVIGSIACGVIMWRGNA